MDYYLSGWAEYSDVVYKTNIKNGDIVPCTNLLENPSSLLEDARFGELFDKLTEDYRYVIIDSAPLVNVADGALIASMCDGACYAAAALRLQTAWHGFKYDISDKQSVL